jgi:hypothetical protein
MVELSESASAKTRRISETLDRFSPPPQVHEAPTPYAIEDEDEDEDETSNQGH